MRPLYALPAIPLLLLPALLPSPAPAQGTLTATKVLPRCENLLANGGFEVWSYGHVPNGPIPPDLWFPLGSAQNLFGQADVTYTRVPEDAACDPNGPWAASITITNAAGFAAQTLESWRELRGRWVTFALDVRTEFAVAAPQVSVWDGLGQTSASVQVAGAPGAPGPWERVVVAHLVDPCATTVELRVSSQQTVHVNDAMAIRGRHADAEYTPRSNPEPATGDVPLGAVIDWYRMDPSVPVPERFAVADGSVVADAASPFVGKALPDLRDRFVLGVGSVGAIGSAGGNATIDLRHRHNMSHTHSGRTDPVYGGNNCLGPGYVCCAPGQTPLPCHEHNFTTNGPSTSNTGYELEDDVSILPPYVGLLKLVRVR